MNSFKFLFFIMLSSYSIDGLAQYNTPQYLIGTWQVGGQKKAISLTKYLFKDTINLWINHLNEKKTLVMHFTIDTINNEQILSIMNSDIEEMSRGFRTYKLRILNNDKITLKPYTIIFFNEKSGKVEERDASHEPEIHLNRIKS
jgi:hypothetical protein